MLGTEKDNWTKNMFFAHIKQSGEGCDYTIACGEKVVKLRANSMANAQEEVRSMLAHDYTARGDRHLESAIIYEVSDTFPVPVDAWYAELEAAARQREAERQTTERHQLFESLKREFGDQ